MDEMHANQEFLFYILFSSVATLAFAASLYLLLRRSNGIAPNITSPVRLRRWTATFFAAAGISQLCWLFIYYTPTTSSGDIFYRALLCTALDSMISAPAIVCTMVVMLQDRRRPLWPIFTTTALYLVYLLLLYIFDIRNLVYVGLPLLLILVVFGIVLARAVRQYDRWLLENFSDLEHKEVWSSITVLAALVITAFAYSLANDYFFFEVFIEVMNYVLIATLLWRVETLQTLEESADDDDQNKADDSAAGTDANADKLRSLLHQYCVEEQFYLRHDASLTQLAKCLGTNTHYLSQYFARQGLTYNTYINGLRIEHFKGLYQESASTTHTVSASDIAIRCGFSSYRTFSRAFKQDTGQSVTEWVDKTNREREFKNNE